MRTFTMNNVNISYVIDLLFEVEVFKFFEKGLLNICDSAKFCADLLSHANETPTFKNVAVLIIVETMKFFIEEVLS